MKGWTDKERENFLGTLEQGLRDYIFQFNNDLLDGALMSRIVLKIFEPYFGLRTDEQLRSECPCDKSREVVDTLRTECF